MNDIKKENTGYLTGFILGGIAGGMLTLLIAPYSGKELRSRINTGANNYIKRAKEKEEELINKARTVSGELLLRAIQLTALVDKYASGIFECPAEKIEIEIRSLRAAIDAAVKTYKGKNGQELMIDLNREISDDILWEYEDAKLPMYEGMKRRKR